MKVLRHRLCEDDGKSFPYEASPNMGGKVDPKYLVIHFTAGPSAPAAINWFKNRESGVSAHIVLDRDGSITQMVPFDRKAWHAGASQWDGLSGLNQYSIGIELVNAGRLQKCDDAWLAWFGTRYDSKEVIEAVHRNEQVMSGWHIFPGEQIEALVELSTVLVQKYNLVDVVGHDDISPGRKTDPGPAFPMQSFRSKVMGRAENEPVYYETTTSLNIRIGPGTEFAKVVDTPLAPETTVEVLDTEGVWRLVDVLQDVNGITDLQGWVHGRYLKRKA